MIRNLGQVAAICIGSSAPRNTNLIWLDNTVVPFVFRAYDGSAWSEIATHKWVRAYVDGWLVTLPPRQLADDGDYMLINSNNVNYKITVKDFVKSAVGNPLDFKGVIRMSADFPNPSTLESGDMYVIITSPAGGTVTDPYSGKTFEDSEKIVWDEVTQSWESLGKIDITVDLTTSYSETEVTIHSSAGKETTIQGATDQLAGVMLPGQYSWLQALSNGSIVPGDPSPLTPLTPAHKHNYNDIINRLVSQQGTGESTIDPMSQKATTDALNLKFDKASVLQVSGAATDKVMSQKAVTDALKTLSDDFNNKLTNYLPLAGGTMKGSIRFPAESGIIGNADGTRDTYILRSFNNRLDIGSVALSTRIISNASDLLHHRSDASYKIWDSYNLSKPTVYNGGAIGTPTTIYDRNLSVNGTGWTFLSATNAPTTSIFAPTTVGTKGYYLVSSGTGAPVWQQLEDLGDGKYLPLIGGTLTGQVTIKQSIDIKLRLQSTDADNYCIIQAINAQASQLGVLGYAGDKWAIGHGGTYYEIWDKYNLTNPVTYTTNTYNHATLTNKDGQYFTYIKAGTNGLLPHSKVALASGGSGSLGTSDQSFNAAYINNLHTNRVTFGVAGSFIDNQSGDSDHIGIGFYTPPSAACPVYVGSLCVSDSYANGAPNIPTNGIYSKGVIKSAAGFTSNFRQTNLNLAKTGNDVLYISSFTVDAAGSPGTDSNTGKNINDGMFLTYFWVNDNAFQLAADIDGTGIAYRQYIPSSGNSTTGWKFLADTNWVVSKINSSTSNFLKKTGDTATGQIILDSNGIAFKANTWTNDLTPNRNYSGYLQVLDAYAANNAGGPTNYGTVLQVNSRNAHWANQLWFSGGAEASKNGLYYRHMAYNQTEYSDWIKLATTSDLGNYLPLSGGTITSSGLNPVCINSTSNQQSALIFHINSSLSAAVGGNKTLGAFLQDGSNAILTVKSDGAYYGVNTSNLRKLATVTDLAGYLSLSGGTMSGSIRFPAESGIIGNADGTRDTYILRSFNNRLDIGSVALSTRIISNASDLLHHRSDASYKIWDSYNLSKPTVYNGGAIGTPTTIYDRNLSVNGTGWTFLSATNAPTTSIFAPTTVGTKGYYLVSSGTGAPVWQQLEDLGDGKYLPLIGGTLTGQVTIKQSIDIKLRLQSTDADNYCIIQAINAQASQLGVLGYAGDKWAIGHGGTYYEIWDKYNLTNPVTYTTNTYNHATLTNKDGQYFTYIKAGTNGLLPHSKVALASGGSGSLGTSDQSFNAAYINNLHTNRVTFGVAGSFIDNQSGDSDHIGIGFYTPPSAACPVYVGSLCVSDSYANGAPNIPTNGIYSKGVIKSAAGFTSNFRQTNLNLAKTGNDVLYISSFTVDAAGSPGTDSNTGKNINDGMFLTYFWVNDNAFQLAADIDGTGIAYRQYIPSSGNSTTGWKFLADTNWVVSKINSSTSNFLKKTGDTATGQIILDSNGIAFKANTWTNDLTPNRNYSGYLQVLDAYAANNAGGPTNYGTVLQVNSRNAHWANQLWFSGGAEASKNGLYYRHMAYNQTEYSDWIKLATTSDLGNYLPLSGGTITSSGLNPVCINSTSNQQSALIFHINSSLSAAVGGNKTLGAFLQDGSNAILTVKSDGAYYGVNTSNLRKLATVTDLAGYLSLSGGTMSGSIFFNGDTRHIVVSARETSNYVSSIIYTKGSTSNAASMGYHSTGGSDKSGALILVPYSTSANPWAKTVGLYIAKNELLLDGKAIATTDQIPSIPSISISNSGSGNAVTAISSSGHTLTVTKGATYLTSHQTIYDLTFQAGTFSAKTFDPNGAAATVNIPTKTSHITNDSGFITSSALNGYATQAWVNSQNFVKSTSTKKVTDIQPVDALPATQASGVLYLVFG